MDAGLLVLRLAVGSLFVVHGTQKLFGWFGGYGLEPTSGFMASLRYRKPRLAALAAGVFESGAGISLAAGLLTPLAAAAIVGVMINAIVTVNGRRGLVGGYELDLLYGVVAASIALIGPGVYSLDRAIGWATGGAAWGAFAIGLGVVTSALVLATRERAPASDTGTPAADEERAA